MLAALLALLMSTTAAQQNPIITSPLPSKDSKNVLEPGQVRIYYASLNISDALDMIRIGVQLDDVDHWKSIAKDGPILEVMVSNGRDSFTIQLPVIYKNDLTLYADGKFLNPVLPEDFEKKKKKYETDSVQNLVITVQSRLKETIRFRLSLSRLDRAQYYLKFREGETTKTVSAHLTLSRALGFYINSTKEEIESLLVEVISEDNICATLTSIAQNASMYESRLATYTESSQRFLTFSKRADIYFPNNEVLNTPQFRIFIFVNPDNSECDTVDPSRIHPDKNKKVTVTFRKIDTMNYAFPILKMMAIIVLPIAIYIVAKIQNLKIGDRFIENEEEEEPTEEVLISFSNESAFDNGQNAHNGELNEIFPAQNHQEPSNSVEPIRDDSLSMQSEIAKYPVAIIIPVFMHTAVEYYKFKSSNMANRDEMCYHNFACAHPYYQIRAFNNIVSNLGYFVFGFLFVCVTLWKRKEIRKRNIQYGVYESVLLDFTMGVFLMMQAIASATYHICPSDVAFQFDTPFIQVICGLIVIRQWIIRFETPSASLSNSLLVAVLFINFMISTLSKTSYVRWTIAVVHLSITILLIRAKSKNTSRNSHATMFAVLFFVLNATFAIIYTTLTEMFHANQITTYCFIINAAAYLIHYTVNKSWCEEKISARTMIYGILSILFWLISIYFYFEDNTDWTKTAAQSRSLNKPCVLFDFFGTHDIWHMTSAFSAFFTFLYVTTIDDDLKYVPKETITKF